MHCITKFVRALAVILVFQSNSAAFNHRAAADEKANDDEKTTHVNLANKITNETNVTTDALNEAKEVNKVNNSNADNDTVNFNLTVKPTECVGSAKYCDVPKEEYIQMLNDYIYPQTYEWVLIAIYIVVFVGGLVGNALVCIAVYRNPSMRTVTNYFLVNLAVADFMVILFCLPPTLVWDVTESWFFGATMCKIILFLQSVSVTVSVLTLTFISVDRWYAICFPLKFKSTTGRAKKCILVIWLISLIFNSPDVVVWTTEKSVQLRFELEYLVQCVPTWSEKTDMIWNIVKVALIYIVPLMLMTVAYYQILKVLWRPEKIPGQADTAKLTPAENSQLQARRKAAKMLAAVVVMFAVCYLPVHTLSLMRYFNVKQNELITILALVSHVLCYTNSAINPLIYNFMNGKFRKEFKRAFCCAVEVTHNYSTTLSRLSTNRPREMVTLDSKESHVLVRQNTMF